MWWKLFNSTDSSKWGNIFTLIELLFTIPLSNGCLERCFSQLKLTKSDRRSCLKEDSLDNLLRIRINGPPLEKWDAGKAVDLWWSDKTQRVNRKDARSTQSIQQSATQPDSDSSFIWYLSDWEKWLHPDIADEDY